MAKIFKITTWLETRFCTPAFSGWVLLGLAICFFGAATNTMAGWLYVLSGLIGALLIIGAVLPMRSLRHLTVSRLPISPVTAGDEIIIILEIKNPTPDAKTLLQIEDQLPFVLGKPQTQAIEVIHPQSQYQWMYSIFTQRRGIYQWQNVNLKTGTPLGLFLCSRQKQVKAKAIVYPTVLPLQQCPIIDSIGQDDNIQFQSEYRALKATEGVTRNLRPYHYGDPMRMIHWRTSAKLGEFKIKELEVMTGSQDIIISLDSGSSWNKNSFEQAVITAASLYFYAQQRQMNVKLWTAGTGIITGNQNVLETLSAIETEEYATHSLPFTLPLVLLTENTTHLSSLSVSSRWIIFNDPENTLPILNRHLNGLIVNTGEDLQQQLQMFSVK
ncbi:DUF58 domain-containing protein [Aphanothece hegewaldii CCALA 016]|uniref:DUF58 domain-containing protein n=1 Tax=Aphanothece hegewaldii CCALA 016 TaxID=2107694 RepID=A0A2T1LV80_9CHRO|nr:DUF58 domain-containing protein [Aphanothece hegewaldii]PSF35425.1 DUF58 domain-containing protein [Aphanothece hegewaldii CCALA 016]